MSLSPGSSGEEPAPKDERAAQLESGQIELLYEQLPSNLLATVLVGLLLTIALRGSVPSTALAVWIATVLVVTAARYWLLRRYRASHTPGSDAARWKFPLLAGVAVNGLLWGAAGGFFFVADSSVLQTLLAFSLAGMSAGAVATLSSVRIAPLLFVVPALVPYTLRLLTFSGRTSVVMASMVAVFAAMMSAISRRLHSSVERSLRLRFENLELIEDLIRARDVQKEAHRALMAQVEETNKAQRALEESHAELERRVQERTRELEEVAARLRATVEELDAQSRAAEEARRVAESASNAKSQFLAVVSHELRTPLNAIVGYQDLLAAEVVGPLNEKQRQYLSRAELGAQQLIGLIDQILNLARIEAGREELRIEEVDLPVLTREVAQLMEPLAAKKGLPFHVHVPDESIRVHTDSGKVRQILLNLLSNAIKFTEKGEVVVQAERSGGAFVLSVRDTGPGIPEQDLDRIFEPFARTKSNSTPGQQAGTGLGLAVSRSLAELLGGSLTVESAVSKGSVFTLRLPCEAESARSEG